VFIKTTVRKRGDKSYIYLSIVESARADGKMTHKTLLRLGEVGQLRESGQLERMIAALRTHAAPGSSSPTEPADPPEASAVDDGDRGTPGYRLANGYCNRSTGSICDSDTLCERCGFFTTSVEFLPTLKRQRADAAAVGRVLLKEALDRFLDDFATQVKSACGTAKNQESPAGD
jgi:hypothetical protein